jgi:SHS2 domain-containing protein
VRWTLPQPYALLDHTADLGVRAEGATAEEALARLVLAAGALLAGGGPAAPGPPEALAVEGGPDLAGTAVAVLREVVFRFATGRRFPAACEVLRLDAAGADLRVAFAPWDPALHAEGADLKAVTWHAARLEPEGEGWVGQLVFDV